MNIEKIIKDYDLILLKAMQYIQNLDTAKDLMLSRNKNPKIHKITNYRVIGLRSCDEVNLVVKVDIFCGNEKSLVSFDVPIEEVKLVDKNNN